MAVADVGESTAKIFAELISFSPSCDAQFCLTDTVAPQTSVRLDHGYLRGQSKAPLVTSS